MDQSRPCSRIKMKISSSTACLPFSSLPHAPRIGIRGEDQHAGLDEVSFHHDGCTEGQDGEEEGGRRHKGFRGSGIAPMKPRALPPSATRFAMAGRGMAAAFRARVPEHEERRGRSDRAKGSVMA